MTAPYDATHVGQDPIDAQMAPPVAWWTRAFRRRAALWLRPLVAPLVVFVPLGFAAGPRGAGLLSETTLAHLDPIVSVALAGLGVLVGVTLGQRQPRGTPIVAAALEAGLTMVVVTAAFLFLLTRWGVPPAQSAIAVALLLGLCAASSAAAGHQTDGSLAADVADLDDLAPIVVGAVALAAVAAPGGGALAIRLVTTIATALLVAGAGWLLFERTSAAHERAVFVLGTLVLLGGIAAYLDGSPLASGLVAGLVWARLPGSADRVIAGDMARFQHPLLVLLLVIAGATIELAPAVIWIGAPLILVRVAGKLAGGWAARRAMPGQVGPDFGAMLIPPGIVGLALALNVTQLAPDLARWILGPVALAGIASEMLALYVIRTGDGP